MPTIKLNRRNVSRLPAANAVTFYWDDDLKGFGLRVMPSGVSTWIVEYRPGVGGRATSKRRVKVGRLDTLAPDRARELAEKLLAQVALGGDPARVRAEARAGMTVAELVEDYVARHVEEKRKASTAEFYRYLLRAHIGPGIGTTLATDVSRADVARLHSAIGKRGRYAANRALAALSATYSWAGRLGLVPEGFNPTQGVERYGEQGRERFLTDAEIARLGSVLREAETLGLEYEVDAMKPGAKHAPKRANRRTIVSAHVTAAIRLLMLTGCRLNEILTLEWSQVDFARGMAFLPDSKSGKKTVVLSDAALAVLETLPRIGRFVVASDSAGNVDEKPRHDIKRPWKAISAAAGLDGLRLHDLRHTFASIGAGSGLGLPVLGALLGHANASTTQRYAHMATDPTKKAADTIADRIASALG